MEGMNLIMIHYKHLHKCHSETTSIQLIYVNKNCKSNQKSYTQRTCFALKDIPNGQLIKVILELVHLLGQTRNLIMKIENSELYLLT
jgi:hypothetical protein